LWLAAAAAPSETQRHTQVLLRVPGASCRVKSFESLLHSLIVFRLNLEALADAHVSTSRKHGWQRVVALLLLLLLLLACA
jgi:hypothetical protein